MALRDSERPEEVPYSVFAYDLGLSPEEYEAFEKSYQIETLPKVLPMLLKEMALEASRRLKVASEIKMSLYSLNDELRTQGEAYKARKAQMEMRQRVVELLKVGRLFPETLVPEDILWIKRLGLRSFTRFNYERLCQI